MERAADLDVVDGDPLRRADARGVVGLAEGAVGVAPRRDVVAALEVELAEREVDGAVVAAPRADPQLAEVDDVLADDVELVASEARRPSLATLAWSSDAPSVLGKVRVAKERIRLGARRRARRAASVGLCTGSSVLRHLDARLVARG